MLVPPTKGYISTAKSKHIYKPYFCFRKPKSIILKVNGLCEWKTFRQSSLLNLLRRTAQICSLQNLVNLIHAHFGSEMNNFCFFLLCLSFFLPMALFATLLSPQMRNRKIHTSPEKNKPNNKRSMNDLEKIAIGNKIRQTSKRTSASDYSNGKKRKEKHKIDVM